MALPPGILTASRGLWSDGRKAVGAPTHRVTLALMIHDVAIGTFSPHVGTEFVLEDQAGRRVALLLGEVRSLGLQPNAPRAEPFALMFTGPAQPFLEQRIYRFEHQVLGPLDIFIVPVGTDDVGALYYEAVFN